MLKPRSIGGLSLGNLENKNWALLENGGVEKEALQRLIIVDQYGEDRWDWRPKSILKYRRLGIWGAIANFGDESDVRGRSSVMAWYFLLGKGGLYIFWFDDCATVGPLRVLYLMVLRVVSNKESSVRDFYVVRYGELLNLLANVFFRGRKRMCTF